MSEHIDCVIVGYKKETWDGLLKMTELSRNQAGTFLHILGNTVRFRGKRVGYFDVLNTILSETTNQKTNYHFANVPSLSAICLASFLQRRSLRTEIVNNFEDEKDRFAELLKQDVASVAITTTFYVDQTPIKEIVQFVRAHNPKTKVVVGGPRIYHLLTDHPLERAKLNLQGMGADVYVFDAQGELTLRRVCDAFGNGQKNLDDIPNLVYLKDGKDFIQTKREVESNDLNENMVDWESLAQDISTRGVSTRTVRGCAFKCSFCRYPILNPHDLASIETIEKELTTLKNMGITHLYFVDDTFNVPKDRFKDLCRMMIRNQFNFKWLCYFRCSNADEEGIELLAQAGCMGVFLGIESGDQTVLKHMNKGANVQRYEEGIKKLHELGIITYATFIAGFPGETDETIQNTIAFIERVRPMFYSMEPYYHDPKVPIAAKADEYGLVGSGYSWRHNTMDWKRATEWSIKAYEQIKHSCILPLNGFDIWSIGYLLAEGMPFDKLKAFLDIMSDMLAKGLRYEKEDFVEHENALLTVFANDESWLKKPVALTQE